jgi:hypothetical protein
VLSRERRIREAQNEDQIAAAMADIERTGLVRTEDLNRLKDDIRTNEHKRGHAFRMTQKKDELELASLQREYELRVRDEDYQFEKRKKDDEFDRFKEIERMKREKEAAEHDRNMDALRKMHEAKLEKMRLSRELTPEQLMALSAENLAPEAAAKLAESLGRSREAEYLERLTQARIDDMKDMVRAASAPAQPAGRFCPSCGSKNSAEAKFCMSCGVALKKSTAKGGNLNGQDKIVMILICFFLGGLGIHNFMMGETKKGIFKIIMSFLCGIGGILALIDLIKIAMDKYVVDPDKLV